MGIKKTLGGDRLGAGKQMRVTMENFGRSSHNQSKVIRTDQAIGTLVPYYCNIGLTGDTFYIDEIESIVRTLPTNGPIFGSLKQQIDVFMIPIRLYIGALHNNALGIGLKMQDIKMPAMDITVGRTPTGENKQNQFAPDCLLSYLGLRGVGSLGGSTPSAINLGVVRTNALALLAYWDIYKNYYANKQEGVGYVLTGGVTAVRAEIEGYSNDTNKVSILIGQNNAIVSITVNGGSVKEIAGVSIDSILIKTNTPQNNSDFQNNAKISLTYPRRAGTATPTITVTDSLKNMLNIVNDNNPKAVTYEAKNPTLNGGYGFKIGDTILTYSDVDTIELKSFPLSNIDDTREAILATPKTTQFYLAKSSSSTKEPYLTSINQDDGNENTNLYNTKSQNGLGIKTYLSDRFNNWLNTEWIDGAGGVNEISSVDVSEGKLSMDALILAKKVYDMLNRIAVSGGSYNDWQEAVYGVRTVRMAESPVYMGGFASEIVFDEVVSNSATESEPLGSLAGRGKNWNSRGGKKIKIKCEEPCLIMAIGSFTPRIDYSQGNKWWTRLETMNDLHKPNLDRIGFQELVTDEIVAADTVRTRTTSSALTTPVYKSVGKQPSWIEYMTEVNETYGSFAAGQPLDFMAFNRSYSTDETGITDMTTYIDPSIYNKAFADSTLNAKNLWVQAGFTVTARRVMSAKQIPNL